MVVGASLAVGWADGWADFIDILDTLSAMLVPSTFSSVSMSEYQYQLRDVVCGTRLSHDLWDISILGKLSYSPHRTGIVYAPHQRGNSIIWVLDIDTLDT